MLSKTKHFFIYLLLIAIVTFNLSCSENHQSADLVLINGNIITLDDSNHVFQAIAVKNDTISNLGSTEMIKKYVDENTRVIDLNGETAIPGFNDSHLHFLSIGKAKMKLQLQDAKNWDEIILMVSQAAENANPGEWILGRGWHQEKWDPSATPSVEGYPVNDLLNRATPYNPVMLTHASGHAVIVNQKALEMSGIDDSTKSPEGGKILRDSNGKATGVLEENAELLVKSLIEKERENLSQSEIYAENKKAIELATEELLANGITSITDAGSTFDEVDFYKTLVDSSLLKVRLNVMLYETNENLREKISDYKIIGYGDNFLTVRSIKKYIDGALGSRGALFLADYSDLKGHNGQQVTPLREMRETAEIAAENGFQLCTHAIGDKGNRLVLNLYKNTFEKFPDSIDFRWRIEHAQHLSIRDIPKFAEYGVIASMQGIHCTSDAPYVVDRLGSYRARLGAYPWRKLIDSGALICNGTDAPIEDVNPVDGFYALVTRRTGDNRAFYPEQSMTRLEALKAYTINGAYASFEENTKGSLEKGKVADITVLSENLLECADWRIPRTEILYTIIDGKVLYEKR